MTRLSDSDLTRKYSRRRTAYAHSKLMGAPLLSVSGQMDFLPNRPVMVATQISAVSLQVQSSKLSRLVTRQQEQNLQAPKSISISRRGAMLYMTAEILSGFSLLSAEPAEARVGKLERKKKIMEKLEKLREEARLSKPKTDKDMTPATPAPPTNPIQGSVSPLVESILP